MAKRRLKRYLYYNLYTFTSLSETTRPRFIVVISWLAHPFFFFFSPLRRTPRKWIVCSAGNDLIMRAHNVPSYRWRSLRSFPKKAVSAPPCWIVRRLWDAPVSPARMHSDELAYYGASRPRRGFTRLCCFWGFG